ncbi:MAG: hypothetical protein Fur0037_16480 [Planctomycetota bacterium]
MRRSRLLLSFWLLAIALLAPRGAVAQGHRASGAAAQAAQHGHGEARSTLEMENASFFKNQYEHSVPHVVWPEDPSATSVPAWLHVWNVNQAQWVVLLAMLLLFVPVVRSFGSDRRPAWLVRVLRGWCRWIRDEMVYSVMGEEDGRKYAPYFIFLFFFIAFMNSLGLIPSVPGLFSTYTATGTPYVTGALAVITFAMMLFFGMRKNGVLGFVKGLLPHGLPAWLIPLMLLVEIVGLVVKPFALMIRLFANMLAGHLVIASLIGLIFLFAKMQHGAPTSYLTAIPGAGMGVFIYIIEAFVTLLQAYIFTYLSIIFVHQAVHQAH